MASNHFLQSQQRSCSCIMLVVLKSVRALWFSSEKVAIQLLGAVQYHNLFMHFYSLAVKHDPLALLFTTHSDMDDRFVP